MERKIDGSKATMPDNQKCCGGTPVSNTDACCKVDEVAKEQGQKGCGCSCSSPKSA
ncbi:hypothetical protein [uncultured Kiloniella sp.]|uniref:hypothetical protein n=1 Tax=uncultured Kiloniella sp. TaxID=1133091 RepID=UPI00262D749F|nr:hypothetical protein [uncultured Kiloniella sp.]